MAEKKKSNWLGTAAGLGVGYLAYKAMGKKATPGTAGAAGAAGTAGTAGMNADTIAAKTAPPTTGPEAAKAFRKETGNWRIKKRFPTATKPETLPRLPNAFTGDPGSLYKPAQQTRAQGPPTTKLVGKKWKPAVGMSPDRKDFTYKGDKFQRARDFPMTRKGELPPKPDPGKYKKPSELTPAERKKYLSKSGEFQSSKFNADQAAAQDKRLAQGKVRQDAVTQRFKNREAGLAVKHKLTKDPVDKIRPVGPGKKGPHLYSEPKLEREPKQKMARSPDTGDTTIKEPTRPFSKVTPGKAPTSPDDYRSIKLRNQPGSRGARQQAAKAQSLSPTLRPNPNLPKNLPTKTGKSTPGTVGYKPTQYTPAQQKKQALLKKLPGYAEKAGVAAGVGALAPIVAGAGPVAAAGLRALPGALGRGGAQVAKKAVQVGNKPIPGLKQAGKIPYAGRLVPTTGKQIAGTVAAEKAIEAAIKQKPKVKTYRAHTQGIRN